MTHQWLVHGTYHKEIFHTVRGACDYVIDLSNRAVRHTPHTKSGHVKVARRLRSLLESTTLISVAVDIGGDTITICRKEPRP